MVIDIRPAIFSDLAQLVPNMIPEDRTEILALGYDPAWAMENCLHTSVEATTFLAKGQVGCMLGISRVNDLAEDVQPWLISTPLIYDYQKEFVRLSRRIIKEWLVRYPLMVNYVDVRHEKAIRWLRWLGAQFDPPAPHGPYRRPFHKFTFGAV